ncbi:MAG TPA: endolytic transglycosylase MltG [Thermoanaerobaculia bacterium]|nr:endolytic transglycosylase MltG [Thermoanaerobaculia bacterium]
MARSGQPRRRGRKYLQSFGILLLFFFLFTLAAGFFFWKALVTPFKGYQNDSQVIEIRRGTNSAMILRDLQKHGVLRDDFIPLVFLKALRRGDSLKAGVYEFRGPASPLDVIDKLVRGDVLFKSITVREGIDRFTIAELMAAEGFGTKAEWLEITAEGDLVRDLDPSAESLEGYLFPDTYKLAPGSRPATIVKTMVENFRKQFGSELAYISTGLDVHDTVTLASIVETEARLPEERPLIASVYLNRIQRNMLLGADPTVIYAMKLEGRWDGNIRRADLRIDSPYNTYRSRGFPPGPIANPGLSSLRAAAAPARSDYLYFVSRNDGSHVFARSLVEHNRNVQIHQRDYWRQRRKAAAASESGGD